jgi:hypothetical protein
MTSTTFQQNLYLLRPQCHYKHTREKIKIFICVEPKGCRCKNPENHSPHTAVRTSDLTVIVIAQINNACLLASWRYCSCRTLAASHVPFHSHLSSVLNLHLLIPIFLRSSSTLSIHLLSGFHIFLHPPCFSSKAFWDLSVLPSYRRVPAILPARL